VSRSLYRILVSPEAIRPTANLYGFGLPESSCFPTALEAGRWGRDRRSASDSDGGLRSAVTIYASIIVVPFSPPYLAWISSGSMNCLPLRSQVMPKPLPEKYRLMTRSEVTWIGTIATVAGTRSCVCAQLVQNRACKTFTRDQNAVPEEALEIAQTGHNSFAGALWL
jgi:hypothetical protein